MRLLVALMLVVLMSAVVSSPASAGALFKNYNIGVTYEASTSYAEIAYDSPQIQQGPVPDDCDLVEGGTLHCTAYLAPDADETPIPSIYLQTPFKRDGLLYFDYGFSFATVTYTGGITGKPKARSTARGKTPPDQPLTKAYLEMYGVSWQTYVSIGLTPLYIPDIILTGGLALKTVVGRVHILTVDTVRGVAQPGAFAEAELVIARWNGGALSGYVAHDQSILGKSGTKLLDDHPAGSQLEDLRMSLSASTAGARLLFPF